MSLMIGVREAGEQPAVMLRRDHRLSPHIGSAGDAFRAGCGRAAKNGPDPDDIQIVRLGKVLQLKLHVPAA